MGTTITKPRSKAVASRAVIDRKSKHASTAKLSGAGVVKFCVEGTVASSTATKFSPTKLVELLQVGMPMIYAVEHLSLAALEVRVHIDRTSLKKRYKCITFDFDERLMKALPANSLPTHWQQGPPPASLQAVGDHWLTSGDSVVLAVPSVIIPAEHNYLLNPRHPDFEKVKPGKPTDFSFDYRLFQ